jgi:integrase
MAGQIICRGENTFLLRVYIGRDGSGKRQYVNKTVQGSKREAQKELTRMLGGKDTKTLTRISKQSVDAFLSEWLSVWVKRQVRPRTLGDYAFIVRAYIVPTIGPVRLSQLVPGEIQALYNALSDRGLSPRTVRYTHTVLRSALAQAVKLNLIIRNPADLAEPPKKVRGEMRALTIDQVGKFFVAAVGDRWEALWHVLMGSGLRPGEALGLKWEDLHGSKLRVQRSMVPGSKGSWILSEPKTGRSRVVVIPETAVRMLREHKRRQNEERLVAGKEYKDKGLMFAMPDGNPPNYRGLVLSHFKRILHKAELPITFSPYSCRHTAATMLLGMGEHPRIVAERLGHSSTQQTMDTYSHVLPDMQERSALKLQEALYG